ncbi:hypothetical protein KIN20_010225 [Parelaphostrongylus tenuis]|uniref:Uncharacterized protein n=1 Tax=Parelaphostrongylus tenuis TaxID=148309 RepID=A0AAD5MRM1_PARTN|nr:hypothetical protein KIN20_010225 [Parelaphostrongylus tenuis]
MPGEVIADFPCSEVESFLRKVKKYSSGSVFALEETNSSSDICSNGHFSHLVDYRFAHFTKSKPVLVHEKPYAIIPCEIRNNSRQFASLRSD